MTAEAVARIDPPLLLGLDLRDLSRSTAELIRAQRRVASSAVDAELARSALRSAHRELARSALSDWRLDLDDERVRLHGGTGSNQIALAGEVARRAARSVGDVARAAAELPWRRDVAAAFREAAESLGAALHTGALELRLTRSGACIEARVRFRDGTPATLVRATFAAGETHGREPSELELEQRVLALDELRGDIQVVGDETIEIRRAGLLASGSALVELVNATLALSSELLSEVRPERGPYR